MDVVAVHQVIKTGLADQNCLGSPADDAWERVDEIFKGSAPPAPQIDGSKEDLGTARLQRADRCRCLRPAFKDQRDLMPLVEGRVRHPGPELLASPPGDMKRRRYNAYPHF